jgi:hypothetical protein
MSSPKPFQIFVSSAKVTRLQQKLALSDFPSEVPSNTNPWSRGVPLSEIKRLTQYWATNFSWNLAQAHLNTFPQFMTRITIDSYTTYDVHFIHQKSSVKNAIPLLFVHGWPGSFIEVTKMLPDLVKGGQEGSEVAFHVVAPSLIDFGFSGASEMVS